MVSIMHNKEELERNVKLNKELLDLDLDLVFLFLDRK